MVIADKKKALKNFLLLNLGILIVAAGTYFFKFPNKFSMGGVSGIAILLAPFTPSFSPAGITFALNLVLMAVGFAFFGKGFGAKTAYASFLLSAEIWALERIVPMSGPFTDQPVLELIFAVMLPAVGSAILFNMDASTGGTDIIAMILKKVSKINIGVALLCSDLVVAVSACFIFGAKIGMLSIVGLAAKSFVVDSVIENINLYKYFTIVTTHPDELSEYITVNLKRGATSMLGNGAFTNEGKTVFLCAVNRGQAVSLRDFVREIDPKAFVLITNTSQIIGRGFRGTF